MSVWDDDVASAWTDPVPTETLPDDTFPKSNFENDHSQFIADPTYVNPPAHDFSDETIVTKLAELDAREAEISQRERNLAEREKAVEIALQRERPNWPSPCCALYRHSIGLLPEQYIRFVRILYTTWLLLCLTLISNFLANLLFLVYYENVVGIKDLMLSGLYFACGVPLSWLLWYYPTYTALNNSNPPSNLRFNLFYGTHLIVTGFGAIGMNNWACVGWLRLIKADADEKLMVTTCLIVSSLWTISFLLSLVTIGRATRTFAQALVFQNLGPDAIVRLLS